MRGLRWRGWSSGPALCGLCLCVLLMPGPRLRASEQSELIESLRQRLTIIASEAARLESESRLWNELLQNSEQRLRELQSELLWLKAELLSLQESSQSLSEQLQALLIERDVLEKKLSELFTILRASAASWEKAYQNLRLSRNRAVVLCVVGGVVLSVVAATVGYTIGRATR